MPGMDRTGPIGTGPVGRGMGPCRGGVAGRGRGRCFFGGGKAGWGAFPSALSPEEEKALLERQKSWLEESVEAVKQRMQNFEKNNPMND